LKLNAALKTVTDSEALLVVDGGIGLGQTMAYDAMELGIQRVKQKGSAIIALRNPHHIGQDLTLGRTMARENLIHSFRQCHRQSGCRAFGACRPLVTNPVSHRIRAGP